MMSGVIEGRIVHYVLAEHDLSPLHKQSVGRHRPAIIVNSLPDLNREDGYSNLLVFLDGSNDEEEIDFNGVLGPGSHAHRLPKFFLWATSRSFSESKENGTWHWPGN